ncbi:S-adenosylmethionine:tRNA ribosyltransferase-isomerase [Puia dinghuensis]|uniref:S-adenosylmethionine:tRNA ribosyltransferase-isomerase n=1 Tax=Puia dinghuensis TaxID=1792502 RepID=A0A8J2UEL0_9BACT|nr:S-adenosylmethionine:tRNA ribosyltransferase-isomerase [Puia dinghuensis]GGB05864.1 S-adenosylmethionine:tRNA ribosyltransferase-isomerase [Puia dinghuensis]
MQPKDISISDYHYDLPAEHIAYHPLPERDASRLLIYRGGAISEDIYRNIAGHLPEESLLVFNNTRVVEARIEFRKETGARIEIFCLEPPADYGGIAAALQQKGRVKWKCLIGGASKWKHGQVLSKKIGAAGLHAADWGRREEPGDGLVLEARYLEKSEDAFLIELSWTPAELSFVELLHRAGFIPLPPYIHRQAEAEDSERYQTIYARQEGSVAAPTAGLHFTGTIFHSLAERKIRRSFVTLHVGAGTFLPVKAATLGGHVMHTEFIDVSRECIRELRETLQTGKPVVAVGTTSARTLESLYWLGLKAMGNEELIVYQWDAYAGKDEGITATDALSALLIHMEEKTMSRLMTTTQLLITPGYDWKVVSGLVTNFHQPESTLLLLIASFIGEDWRRVYSYALEHGFRFLSYGDGCLLWPLNCASAGIRG